MSRSLKIDSSEDQIRAIQTLEMAGVEIRAIHQIIMVETAILEMAIQIRAEIIS